LGLKAIARSASGRASCTRPNPINAPAQIPSTSELSGERAGPSDVVCDLLDQFWVRVVKEVQELALRAR
jgi:hypothetical protein